MIRDLGSTNGCRVNGQKTKSGALLPNDVLSIAVFDFRLFVGDNAPGSPAPNIDRTEFVDLSQLAALDCTDPVPGTAPKLPTEKPSKEEHRGGGGYSVRE